MNLPRNTCIYKLSGTETFRAASAAIFGYGTNLQNIEKSMRCIYYADDGKLFCQTDQSGAEALIVAYLARAGKYRDLFLNNVKPHVFVAMNVFLDKWKMLCKDIDVDSFARTPIAQLKTKLGWDILDKIIKDSDNWSPQERYYFIAKMIVHASSYGMKGGTFQMNVLEKSRGQIVLTRKQSDDYLMGFHSVFPEITEWQYDTIKMLKDYKVLYNLFGFPRQLTGRFDEYDAKEWFAFVPQSTVGCITHIEITQEQQYIDTTNRVNTVHPIPKLPEPVVYCLDTFGSKEADWDILANTHDSSLTQAPEHDIERLGRVKQYLMCQTLTSPRGEIFKMKAETQIGRNWSPRKEIKDSNGNIIEIVNEDGLKELKLN